MKPTEVSDSSTSVGACPLGPHVTPQILRRSISNRSQNTTDQDTSGRRPTQPPGRRRFRILYRTSQAGPIHAAPAPHKGGRRGPAASQPPRNPPRPFAARGRPARRSRGPAEQRHSRLDRPTHALYNQSGSGPPPADQKCPRPARPRQGRAGWPQMARLGVPRSMRLCASRLSLRPPDGRSRE
jgi:hypothetical protein